MSQTNSFFHTLYKTLIQKQSLYRVFFDSLLFHCGTVHVYITVINYSQVSSFVQMVVKLKTNTCVGVQLHLIVLTVFHFLNWNIFL